MSSSATWPHRRKPFGGGALEGVAVDVCEVVVVVPLDKMVHVPDTELLVRLVPVKLPIQGQSGGQSFGSVTPVVPHALYIPPGGVDVLDALDEDEDEEDDDNDGDEGGNEVLVGSEAVKAFEVANVVASLGFTPSGSMVVFPSPKGKLPVLLP